MKSIFKCTPSKCSSLVINILLSIVSIIISLSIAELFLKHLEEKSSPNDVRGITHSNIDYLLARKNSDSFDLRLFNGCFMDGRVMKKDPVLGFVNMPFTEGYSVHVYGGNNFVVCKPFDLSIIKQKGMTAEVSSFRINNLGNRGPDMLFEKPVDVIRMVFLGDSITFGYYVEQDDTFVSKVGQALTAYTLPGFRVETVNAGVSSLNAAHIFNHLKERTLSWSPDIVLWSFYANDIYDSGNQEIDLFFPVRKLGPFSFLRHSAIGRSLCRVFFSTKVGSSMGIDYHDDVNILIERSWQDVEQKIVNARNILQEKHVPLVIVVCPSAIQFSRPWTVPFYQGRLKEICKKHDIVCIDLLPYFEREGPANKLYFSQDTIHPNVLGHAIAARQIVSQLLTNRHLLRFLKK